MSFIEVEISSVSSFFDFKLEVVFWSFQCWKIAICHRLDTDSLADLQGFVERIPGVTTFARDLATRWGDTVGKVMESWKESWKENHLKSSTCWFFCIFLPSKKTGSKNLRLPRFVWSSSWRIKVRPIRKHLRHRQQILLSIKQVHDSGRNRKESDGIHNLWNNSKTRRKNKIIRSQINTCVFLWVFHNEFWFSNFQRLDPQKNLQQVLRPMGSSPDRHSGTTRTMVPQKPGIKTDVFPTGRINKNNSKHFKLI